MLPACLHESSSLLLHWHHNEGTAVRCIFYPPLRLLPCLSLLCYATLKLWIGEREGGRAQVWETIKGNGRTMIRVASFPDFAWDGCTMWSPPRWPLIQAAGCYGNTCCHCWTRFVQHSWGFFFQRHVPPIQITHQTWHQDRSFFRCLGTDASQGSIRFFFFSAMPRFVLAQAPQINKQIYVYMQNI